MKPLIILAFVLFIMGATSCKKHDDPAPLGPTYSASAGTQGEDDEQQVLKNTHKRPTSNPNPDGGKVGKN